MTRPLIDPREQIERALAEGEGIVTPRTLAELVASLERFADAPPQRVIPQETQLWHRANVGDVGNNAYLMRVAVPSGDATWAMANLALDTPALGRVLFARIWASEAVTAGTITPRLRVIEGSDTTDYDLSDLELSTAVTRKASTWWDWDSAIQIASGATVEMRAVSASSMTPTTIDVSCAIVIGYDLDA